MSLEGTASSVVIQSQIDYWLIHALREGGIVSKSVALFSFTQPKAPSITSGEPLFQKVGLSEPEIILEGILGCG